MRLLIVDDEYDKAGEISKVVSAAGLGVEVEHATTAASARRSLRQKGFDFLVIDLNLPDTLGASPTPRGGIEFFDMLLVDEKVELPIDVLFITALEDLLVDAKESIEKRGGTLCQFSNVNGEWKSVITGKLNLASQRSRRAEAMRPRADIAIVTALLKPELDAVLDLKYQWTDKRFPDDPSAYHFGSIVREGATISVVAASALRKGMPSSAALAAKMVERFKPKYLVMLGICAGVRGKTNLGDVIVADPSWDCGSGKFAEGADGSQVFLAAPYPHPLDPQISQIASELAGRPETSRTIKGSWMGAEPPTALNVRVGPMASGAAVLASSQAILPITAQNRELLGVEMEAYAVMAAADYARRPSPIPIVIKSVCDFADSTKSDDWQRYASFTSAAFFDLLVRNPDFPVPDLDMV